LSFDVEIIWVKKFDTMRLHPLTRLSAIRKLLEQDASDEICLDEYWFTLDGKEHLKEWRRLWDLDVISGSTLYMRSSHFPQQPRHTNVQFFQAKPSFL
jgi:hypothetical protein